MQQEDVSVQLEALDILSDLLSRFGALLITFHPTILGALLPQLSSPRQAVRKRYFAFIYILLEISYALNIQDQIICVNLTNVHI